MYGVSYMTIVRSAVRYWGRKVGNALEKVRKTFLNLLGSSGLVLDPFAGAGSIGKRLLTWEYKVVMIDINFYAWLISRVLIGRVREPSHAFWHNFNNTKLHIVRRGKVEKIKWSELFSIRCGKTRSLMLRRECDEVENRCILHTISGCSIKTEYVDFIDKVLDPYPRLSLSYPNGNSFDKRRNVQYVHELYSPLMLAGMAGIARFLRKHGYSVKRGLVGPLLWLSLAAIAYSTSRMARSGSGAWAINSYWIPRRHAEYNPFLRFKRRVSLLAKESLGTRVVYSAKTALRLRWLNYDAAVLWMNSSKVGEIFPREYFDALVTDPPHFDEIQYYELSFLHLAWLLIGLNREDRERALNAYRYEIVMNAKRNMDANKYLRRLHEAFQSIALVLRRGAPIAIFLHEEQYGRLKKMVDAIESAGYRFIVKETIDIPTKPIGYKSTAPGTNKAVVLIGRRELTL